MQFTGIHAVLYALFGEDGALDREAMRRQVELMIGCGVAGITVLGLATEVAKLTEGERRDAIAWAAEDVAGRVPLSVTVFGNSVPEQTALVRAAEAAGADWLILQPPMVGTYGGRGVHPLLRPGGRDDRPAGLHPERAAADGPRPRARGDRCAGAPASQHHAPEGRDAGRRHRPRDRDDRRPAHRAERPGRARDPRQPAGGLRRLHPRPRHRRLRRGDLRGLGCG